MGPTTGLDDMEKQTFLTLPGHGTPTPRSSSRYELTIPQGATNNMTMTCGCNSCWYTWIFTGLTPVRGLVLGHKLRGP
jgi:hypothetical protein